MTGRGGTKWNSALSEKIPSDFGSAARISSVRLVGLVSVSFPRVALSQKLGSS
jgi:hypothetical protein